MEIFRRNNVRFIAANNGRDSENTEPPTLADIYFKHKGKKPGKSERAFTVSCAGTATEQGAGYGRITDKAAGLSTPVTAALFWTFIRPINRKKYHNK